jgi:hypothetical protein
MREYTTIEVRCRKELKIAEIFEFLSSKVQNDANLFSFRRAGQRFFSGKKRKLFDELNLAEFEYSYQMYWLENASRNTEMPMVSNLDDRWELGNESATRSLNESEWNRLVEFAGMLNSYDADSFFLGLDEIRWNGEPVRRGTNGTVRPDSGYGLGHGYLSNCVIIGKTYTDKTYIARICCEKEYRSLEIIDEIVEFLGKVNFEASLFAPEDDAERAEWERTITEAKQKLNSDLVGTRSIKLDPVKKGVSLEKEINMPRLIKKTLCVDGWETRKPKYYERPTVIYKKKGEAEISLMVMSNRSRNRCYYLNVDMLYSNVYFNLGHTVFESFSVDDEEQAVIFLNNVKKLADYVYDAL